MHYATYTLEMRIRERNANDSISNTRYKEYVSREKHFALQGKSRKINPCFKEERKFQKIVNWNLQNNFYYLIFYTLHVYSDKKNVISQMWRMKNARYL